MGAFVASGGMDTLRYHAIAVHIGDVLTDEADDQTFFVDFRFRFISEQARTFFIKQFFGRSAIENGAHSVRCVYPKPMYPIPRKLVSLMSNDPRSERSVATLRTVPSEHLEKQRSTKKEEDHGVMDSSRHEEVSKSVAERKVETLDRERVSVAREKTAFLPDTMWIDRKEALSKILRPADTTEPVTRDDANTFTGQLRHTAGPSYQSDSNSDSSYQTSCDLSDDEFAQVGRR